MARRRLSQRQRQRIRAIQERRRQRASQRQDTTGSGHESGVTSAGRVIARQGRHFTVEDESGMAHRCVARQNLDAIVCGDQVIWQPSGHDQGIIIAVQPRRNLLARPGADGRIRPLAANLDQIVVVIAPRPEISETLLDRYLAVAELSGIRPVILLNKTDLLDEQGIGAMQERLQIYRDIGYPLLLASLHREHGLDALARELHQRTSILVGQSGVGKSSLVKALLPETDIRIGDISPDTGLGRHTTSDSRLYHLPRGGDLIDTPGVRDFGLWKIEPERLIQGFPDLLPFAGRCRFSDCSHRVEPGCAMQQALKEGRIDPRRLNGYLDLRDALSAG